jgi:hypothetical protein
VVAASSPSPPPPPGKSFTLLDPPACGSAKKSISPGLVNWPVWMPHRPRVRCTTLELANASAPWGPHLAKASARASVMTVQPRWSLPMVTDRAWRSLFPGRGGGRSHEVCDWVGD